MKLSERLSAVIGPEREEAVQRYYRSLAHKHERLQGSKVVESEGRLIFVRGAESRELATDGPCPVCGVGVLRGDEKPGLLLCDSCGWGPPSPGAKKEEADG